MGYELGYELMWDTIRCLALSGIDLSDNDIANYLEEIEGDNYAFLHSSNLIEYKQLGLLDDDLIELILLLRLSVEDLSMNLWTPEAFKESSEWVAIHQSANRIFRQLRIPKQP